MYRRNMVTLLMSLVFAGTLRWLDEAQAHWLLDEAEPTANITPAERVDHLAQTIDWLRQLEAEMNAIAQARGEAPLESHRRVRQATQTGRVNVKTNLPVDMFGVYVLLPVPQDIVR